MKSSGYQPGPAEFWKHSGISVGPLGRADPAIHLAPSLLLTVANAATRLCIPKAIIYKLCATGQLSHIWISTHSIRFQEKSLAALLGSR